MTRPEWNTERYQRVPKVGKRDCRRCGRRQDATEFYRRASEKDGLSLVCRTCVKKRATDRLNPSKRTAREIEYDKERHQAIRSDPVLQERQRDLRMRRFYGISAAQYDEMLLEQGGVCKVCERFPAKRALAVDHDHSCCPGSRSCGRCVRGLLCGSCNLVLGHVKDSAERLRRLAAYVQGASEPAGLYPTEGMGKILA